MKDGFQSVREAYLRQLREQQEEISEARPVRTMSARDLDKKINSLEETHSAILDSLVDSFPEDYPVRDRENLEKELNDAYQEYFKVLSRIEKILG